MAWIRCSGGSAKSNFPWGAIANGGFNKIQATVGVAQSDSFVTSIKSPKIEGGCVLNGTVLGAQYSIVVAVSTDGNTWVNVYTANLQSNANFTANLNSFTNAELYIRVYLTNQGGTSTTYRLSSCYIDK